MLNEIVRRIVIVGGMIFGVWFLATSIWNQLKPYQASLVAVPNAEGLLWFQFVAANAGWIAVVCFMIGSLGLMVYTIVKAR